LHYTSIQLHKQQHSGIYHKMPLPCTTPVYSYTNSNTAVSTTKCRYIALHQYTVTQTATQRYLPQNAFTLHYTSILLHKQQHRGVYDKMLLPFTTPVYSYTNSNTAISTTKCRYIALHQYTVTQTATQPCLPQNVFTFHNTSIRLHKQQHNRVYHKMPLPCTAQFYCYLLNIFINKVCISLSVYLFYFLKLFEFLFLVNIFKFFYGKMITFTYFESNSCSYMTKSSEECSKQARFIVTDNINIC